MRATTATDGDKSLLSPPRIATPERRQQRQPPIGLSRVAVCRSPETVAERGKIERDPTGASQSVQAPRRLTCGAGNAPLCRPPILWRAGSFWPARAGARREHPSRSNSPSVASAGTKTRSTEAAKPQSLRSAPSRRPRTGLGRTLTPAYAAPRDLNPIKGLASRSAPLAHNDATC